MPEQGTRYRSYDPDIDGHDENADDHRVSSYRFGQSSRTNPGRGNSVPLFLSDSDGEPDSSEYEYLTPARKTQRPSVSSRILAGALAIAALAVLLAAISSDATRDIIVNAKASIAAVLPAPSAAAQPDPAQLTANDIQLKDPARLPAPANQTAGARRVATIAVTPTRAEITTAYQSAAQGRAPAAAAPPAAIPPTAAPARRLDADELATLLSRARGLLSAGDIPPARLLLERAADAQEAGAALLLARTYDPDVLGTQDARNIIADPAAARAWYQRAAQLGSSDAQRRLSQLQN
jgi:TPR repeat protein